MDTEAVMRAALDMAGMKTVPPDSGIHVPGKDVRSVLFSIDVSTSELLLARDLGCDLVIAHHPLGRTWITFPQVLRIQEDLMVENGVPLSRAQEAAKEVFDRVSIRVHPTIYDHVVSAAKALNIPLMNIHLPCDKVGRDFVLDKIERSGAESVGELIDRLHEIHEFQKAETKIELVMGERENKLGKCVLAFATGTNGGYPVAKALFDHGANTVIYMHIDDQLVKLRKDCRGNLIVLGHQAGDSIGINLFVRILREKGIKVTTVGIVE